MNKLSHLGAFQPRDLTIEETVELHLSQTGAFAAHIDRDAPKDKPCPARCALKATHAIISALDAARAGRAAGVADHLRAFVIAYDAGALERHHREGMLQLESTYHALANEYALDYTAVWAELPAARVIEDLPPRGPRPKDPSLGRHGKR